MKVKSHYATSREYSGPWVWGSWVWFLERDKYRKDRSFRFLPLWGNCRCKGHHHEKIWHHHRLDNKIFALRGVRDCLYYNSLDLGRLGHKNLIVTNSLWFNPSWVKDPLDWESLVLPKPWVPYGLGAVASRSLQFHFLLNLDIEGDKDIPFVRTVADVHIIIEDKPWRPSLRLRQRLTQKEKLFGGSLVDLESNEEPVLWQG